jgi:hypothetical protein
LELAPAVIFHRGFGVEVFNTLSHDFVLRRKVRVATSRDKSTSFVEATSGSLHIGLCSRAVECPCEKRQVRKNRRTLQDVNSNESFGLVKTRHVEAYATLSKIKDDEGSIRRTLSNSSPVLTTMLEGG